jgi:hypothetical protein
LNENRYQRFSKGGGALMLRKKIQLQERSDITLDLNLFGTKKRHMEWE